MAGAVTGILIYGLSLWNHGLTIERGAALFEGKAPLPGRLVGHDTTLPTMATRCANCHDGAAPIGGTLTAERLTHAHSRRGGPPSNYDTSTLCKLLRSGIDPALVMIASAMPRYEITDTQCKDLWNLLTTRQAVAAP